MTTQITPETATLSRLFSSQVIHEMARHAKSPLFARIADHILPSHQKTQHDVFVHSVFDRAYTVFKQADFRDEYIYKNSLANKILLGKHSVNTATLLHEFRAGICKADAVIINGTSTAYEIKSERDSLSRVRQQLDEYTKIFARVNVIAGFNHIERIQNLVDSDIGILTLTKRNTISTIREPVPNEQNILPAYIFHSLRMGEAKRILQLYNKPIPQVPNTQMHRALEKEFCSLTPEQAHSGMVYILKKTRNCSFLSDFGDSLPKSLYGAVLSVPLSQHAQARLLYALRTPITDALAWT